MTSSRAARTRMSFRRLRCPMFVLLLSFIWLPGACVDSSGPTSSSGAASASALKGEGEGGAKGAGETRPKTSTAMPYGVTLCDLYRLSDELVLGEVISVEEMTDPFRTYGGYGIAARGESTAVTLLPSWRYEGEGLSARKVLLPGEVDPPTMMPYMLVGDRAYMFLRRHRDLEGMSILSYEYEGSFLVTDEGVRNGVLFRGRPVSEEAFREAVDEARVSSESCPLLPNPVVYPVRPFERPRPVPDVLGYDEDGYAIPGPDAG